MSGFLVNLSIDSQVDGSKFKQALAKQNYRGPDFVMTEAVNPKLFFGANCLELGDKESSESLAAYEKSVLVLDGEIYNSNELAGYLSDTYQEEFNKKNTSQIVAVGLCKEGKDFLSKLNGPFALCFYNFVDKTLLVSRDLVGMRSVYVYQDHQNIVISSDIISIKEYGSLSLNQNYLYRMAFLDHFAGFDNTETAYLEINLPANGGYIIINEQGGVIENQQFESYDFKTNNTDLATAESEFKPILEKVFALESNTSAKVGIFLSGGIDSTTIAVLASEYILKHQSKIPVFTYTFDEKGDDADYIASHKVLAELKNRFGDVYELITVNLDPEITNEDFEQTLAARNSPILDVREIMYVKMYQKAHEHGVKVILNGMGSDEIFYGYYPLDYWLSIFYREGKFDTENVLTYFKDRQNSLRMSVYTEEFINYAEQYCKAWLNDKFSAMPHISEQPKQVTWFLTQTINPALLMREEKGGSFSGVEVRFPLVNQSLARYSSQINYKHHLVSTTSGRHLIRKAIENKLDKSLVYREKNSGPKKRHYWDELWVIYQENREDLLQSEFLKTIYQTEFLQDPSIIKNKKDYVIYGNENDILLEMLGWHLFQKNNF